MTFNQEKMDPHPLSAGQIPDITVILCAYTQERWDDLFLVMDSLSRQTIPPKDIILVIDHNPELFELARIQAWNAKVIENQEERGLSGARNTAIAIAQGEWLAFIDEDAIADTEWLARLSAHFQEPDLLGVGGSIQPSWQSGRPSWFPSEFDWVVGCTYTGMPNGVAPVRNLIGCNMVFHSRVFAQVGGFRSGIGRIGKTPLGCEETELCIRARGKWGEGKFFYDPAALVQHKVPKSRGTWRYFLSRCYAEGISKALVTSLVGSKDGLDSERTYVQRTLPQGFFRNLSEVIFKRDISGLGRSAAILLGLAATTWGYLLGIIKNIRRGKAQTKSASLVLSNAPGEADISSM